MKRIYLDYAACYPLPLEVKTKVVSMIKKGIWNPSSLYHEGRCSKNCIDITREIVSESLGCLFGEVIFCSSGTEAVNMALIGVALANKNPTRKKILISRIEHPCVLEATKTLITLGYEIDFLPVTSKGILDLEAFKNKLDEQVLLVSVVHANNEVGTIQPMREVVQLAKEKGCIVHTDAAQTFLQPLSFSQENWKVSCLNADLVSISGHKIGALPGIGALYICSGTKIEPLIQGGGQERDMRGGTENLLGIFSLGEAIKSFNKQKNIWDRKNTSRLLFFNTLLEKAIIKPILSVPNLENTLSGHLHLRFPGIPSDSFLIRLDRIEICASGGSACSSGSLEPSHVLKAMNFNDEEAMQGIRFTFGSDHPNHEMEKAALRICEILHEMNASK